MKACTSLERYRSEQGRVKSWYRVAEFTAEAEKPTVAIGGRRVLLHVVMSNGAREVRLAFHLGAARPDSA